MSCAVVRRYRLVAPHFTFHFIFPVYHKIPVYLLWKFTLLSCQLQVPTAHLLYLKEAGTNSFAFTFALLRGAQLWGT